MQNYELIYSYSIVLIKEGVDVFYPAVMSVVFLLQVQLNPKITQSLLFYLTKSNSVAILRRVGVAFATYINFPKLRIAS